MNAGRRRGLGRYTVGAWAYDVPSLEWPVYRAGRLAGIELLRLKPGSRVLDVGCGTGLNLPLLAQVVVDLSLPRRWWAPLAWFMCATGGVHPERRVWEQVRTDMVDCTERVLRGGNIRVAAGSWPDRGAW